jgi:hypothetical protein
MLLFESLSGRPRAVRAERRSPASCRTRRRWLDNGWIKKSLGARRPGGSARSRCAAARGRNRRNRGLTGLTPFSARSRCAAARLGTSALGTRPGRRRRQRFGGLPQATLARAARPHSAGRRSAPRRRTCWRRWRRAASSPGRGSSRRAAIHALLHRRRSGARFSQQRRGPAGGGRSSGSPTAVTSSSGCDRLTPYRRTWRRAFARRRSRRTLDDVSSRGRELREWFRRRPCGRSAGAGGGARPGAAQPAARDRRVLPADRSGAAG